MEKALQKSSLEWEVDAGDIHDTDDSNISSSWLSATEKQDKLVVNIDEFALKGHKVTTSYGRVITPTKKQDKVLIKAGDYIEYSEKVRIEYGIRMCI